MRDWSFGRRQRTVADDNERPAMSLYTVTTIGLFLSLFLWGIIVGMILERGLQTGKWNLWP